MQDDMHDQPQTGVPGTGSEETIERSEREWAMLIHLTGLCNLFPLAGIVVPLVLWSIKRDESRFIDESGKDAVNFQISILVYTIVSVILAFVIIGVFLLIAVGLLYLICTIMGAVHAYRGDRMKYPLAIRFFQ